MTRTELLELIANGENSEVEFKRDDIDARQLAKELVALANLDGGCVILGVEDDGSISGLTRTDAPVEKEAPDDPAPDRASPGQEGPGQKNRAGKPAYSRLEQWVMHVCRDKVRPELNPRFGVWRAAGSGLDVAVVRVERGYAVHHVWHNRGRRYYIRVGSTSREASPEELARLLQQRHAIRPEIQPVAGTSVEHLDRRRLVEYFEQVRGQTPPALEPPEEWRQSMIERAFKENESAWRELVAQREREWRETRKAEWVRLLVNTEFLDDGEACPATVAGLLLFGKNPSRVLPQSKIDAVAYPGPEKDYEARERSTLRGPLVALHDADGRVLEPGLVEQAVDFIRRHTRTTVLENGVRRVDRWDYPEEAIREAVINAVVHRDYLLSHTDVELSIYSNRLEVVSPGRLPNGITPEHMKAGCRSARNELIKDVMRDYGYLEHMGMGVPRKIVRGMREHNGTEPEFIAENERLTVRLWREPTGDDS